MKIKSQSSYRQILKATTLFGGVEVLNIVVSIIRSKFVAVLLGPVGMGIAGLFTSTTHLISGMTNFGLGTSAVRDVASANGTGDENRISTVVNILRRWVWFTGLLGMLVMIIFSPWLSQITFDNREFTMAFIWVSITLLFMQLSSGQLVLLQGMRKYQYLAQASLFGHVLGLLITVPLYFIFGMDGIVPAIIIAPLISLLISSHFAKKVKIPSIQLSVRRIFAEGKTMLIMGIMISLSSLIAQGTSYLVRIFISNRGGVEQVGLYVAGFAIINRYVGVIFTAMGKDYYPRLAAVGHNDEMCEHTINQQAEISILFLSPIILALIVYIQIMVRLLYSNKFVLVDAMLKWAALGIYFKAVSWALSYVFLAKGASKLFFWNELIGSVYVLGFNILGYYWKGLTGLGISFMMGFLLYLVQVYIIIKIKYRFSFDSDFLRILCLQFSMAVGGFAVMSLLAKPYSYLCGSGITLISAIHSYRELDKRIGVKIILQRMFIRKSTV